MVFEVCLRSRIEPNMFVGLHNFEIFNIPSFNRSQLYVAIPSWYGHFEPSRAQAVPAPPIFEYYSFRMLGPAYVDADT